MTPKFDKLCIEFVKRLPDQLEDIAFIPGTGALPRAYNMSAESIIDYINRALQSFFNLNWTAVKGDVQAFINLFPELQKVSNVETLTNDEFIIDNPYLDFFRIIAATTTEGILIKPKAESLYLHYKTGKYKNYRATLTDPVIIQIPEKLVLFPSGIAEFIFHYIKLPLDPETGEVLEQNGDYDSPYSEQWHKSIVDLAYNMYLEETVQTT